ncbi:MAG TPA: glycogen-binding domain-containing protein, partial [Gemmatimonadales bacterium]|nr:glycogen-binding domain-containing protein [Gemmatimonadales bacterium]
FTLGPATIAGSLLPTSVDPGGRYLDAELGLRAGWRRLELAAGAGRRWWRGDSLAGESWASVGLELGLLPGLALTAAAGRFPPDPIRGYLEGSYLQFGARIGRRPGYGPEGWALRQAYRTRPPIAAPVVRGFEVRTQLAVRHFLVDAPGAARVELAGDFTDWEPIALERWEDGTWRAERVVEPGSYRFNLRVDGGPWGAPPGVVTVRDEYGGVAAVLVLE